MASSMTGVDEWYLNRKFIPYLHGVMPELHSEGVICYIPQPTSVDFGVSGKSILLIVGGGIAAYKSLELVRRLSERGIHTCAILTKAGAEFITPLSLSALTGE